MKINPYFMFNGNCEAAFKFYEQCLGGKIVAMMTYAESPTTEQMPSELHSKIMHVCLDLGNCLLMGSDSQPEYSKVSQGFSVQISTDEPAEAERIFHALAENGRVKMPLDRTFWSARFGMLVDQFGIPWMVNCEQTA